MRLIQIRGLDKARPVPVLTRELMRPHLNTVTAAPITTTVRGVLTEVTLTAENGLETSPVASCDNTGSFSIESSPC
jgi:mRNA interferase MazF